MSAFAAILRQCDNIPETFTAIHLRRLIAYSVISQHDVCSKLVKTRMTMFGYSFHQVCSLLANPKVMPPHPDITFKLARYVLKLSMVLIRTRTSDTKKCRKERVHEVYEYFPQLDDRDEQPQLTDIKIVDCGEGLFTPLITNCIAHLQQQGDELQLYLSECSSNFGELLKSVPDNSQLFSNFELIDNYISASLSIVKSADFKKGTSKATIPAVTSSRGRGTPVKRRKLEETVTRPELDTASKEQDQYIAANQTSLAEFECSCGSQCLDEQQYKQHQVDAHGTGVWLCAFDGCEIISKDKSRARKHYRVIHKKVKLWRCTFPPEEGQIQCNHQSEERSDVCRHVELVHKVGKSVLRCDKCDTPFSSVTKLNEHSEGCGTKPQHKLYECDVCGKMYRSARRLREHKTYKHEDADKFMCDLCGTAYQSMASLKQHKEKKHPVGKADPHQKWREPGRAPKGRKRKVPEAQDTDEEATEEEGDL